MIIRRLPLFLLLIIFILLLRIYLIQKYNTYWALNQTIWSNKSTIHFSLFMFSIDLLKFETTKLFFFCNTLNTDIFVILSKGIVLSKGYLRPIVWKMRCRLHCFTEVYCCRWMLIELLWFLKYYVSCNNVLPSPNCCKTMHTYLT